jgi:hypothetical protein
MIITLKIRQNIMITNNPFSNHRSTMFFDLAISTLMGVFILFSLGLSYAILFTLTTIFITFKTIELTSELPYSSMGATKVLSDIIGLGTATLANTVIELIAKGMSNVSNKMSEAGFRDADALDRVGRGLGDQSLVEEGARVTDQAEIVKIASVNIDSYNDVFFGLGALEVTLAVYVMARIIFVIYIFTRNK